jgi:hypothetical protein
MSRAAWVTGVFSVFSLLMLGCSADSGPKTVPVEGTVTLSGKPVEEATVTFAPQFEGGRTAAGITDASGKFTLNPAGAGVGAMPGTFKVTITKAILKGVESQRPQSQEEGMKQSMEMAQKMREAGPSFMGQQTTVEQGLPEKYGSPDTSGIVADVVADSPNKFSFDLTP